MDSKWILPFLLCLNQINAGTAVTSDGLRLDIGEAVNEN
jgi:hypothetical protein